MRFGSTFQRGPNSMTKPGEENVRQHKIRKNIMLQYIKREANMQDGAPKIAKLR